MNNILRVAERSIGKENFSTMLLLPHSAHTLNNLTEAGTVTIKAGLIKMGYKPKGIKILESTTKMKPNIGRTSKLPSAIRPYLKQDNLIITEICHE